VKRPFLTILTVVLAVMLATSVSFDPARAGSTALFAGMTGVSLVLACVGAVWAHREERLSEWLTPRWGDLTASIVLAVSTFAGAWAFFRFVTPQGTPREAWIVRVYAQIGDISTLRTHLGLVFACIVLVAASEEIVWRGWVTALLEPHVGSRRAWMVSAFLYALAHAPTAWLLRDDVAGPNPVIVLGALGAGLFWGASSRVFGRLTPVIIAHVIFDWAAVVMFRFWGPSV
jgi:uncharacterized protein